MEKKVNEKGIKDVINSLLDSADALDEDDESEMALYQTASKFIVPSNGMDMFFLLDYNIDKIKRIACQNEKMGQEEETIMCNYEFIKNIITHVIQQGEGSCCSVDKANTVIRNFIKTKNKEKVIFSHKEWYEPKIGTLKEWNALVEGTAMLAIGGVITKFLVAIAPILKKYEEKKGEE